MPRFGWTRFPERLVTERRYQAWQIGERVNRREAGLEIHPWDAPGKAEDHGME
jgi:hypothetical protein